MKHGTHLGAITVALAAALLPGLAPLAAAAGASSNTPPALHLTLSEAVEAALRLNPGLKAAGHQATAATRDASAAARGRWGELDSTASYSYFNHHLILVPMYQELLANGISGLPFDRSQAQYGLVYQFPLYLGGKLNNQIHIARLESSKAAALLEGNRWQVRFNVVSLYSTAQALDQILASLDEQLATLRQTQSTLEEMVKLGKRPEVDRLKVVDELEGVKGQRASVQADRIKVGALLLSLLGRDPAAGVTVDPLTGSADFQSAVSPTSSRRSVDTNDVADNSQAPRIGNPRYGRLEVRATNSLLSAADNNSAVRAARLAAEQADRGLKVARSDFLPKVYAGASYEDYTGTETDRTLAIWTATVSVKLPLFEGNARFKRREAARQRQAAAREALTEARLKVQADLQDALARRDAARAQLTAAKAQGAAATEAARIEQVRYDTGASTIEDLLRARAREEGAKAAVASAQAGLVTAGERINSVVEKEVIQ